MTERSVRLAWMGNLKHKIGSSSSQKEDEKLPVDKMIKEERNTGVDVFLYISLGGLLLFCFIMTYVQMNKYFAEKSTIAHKVDDSHELLNFPAVSVCPGFKVDKVKELIWPILFFESYLYSDADFSSMFPTNRTGMEELWDEITFAPEEIFSTISTEYHPDAKENGNYAYHTAQDLLGKVVGCLSLDQHDTLTGKCYTITTWCQIPAIHSLGLILNFTGLVDSIIPISLHHPKAYLGNNLNFFPGPVVFQDIHHDTLIDLVGQMKINVAEDGKDYESEDAYYDCINKAGQDAVAKLVDHFCFFPSYRSIFGKELSAKLEPCSNASQYLDMLGFIYDPLIAIYRDHGCPKPKKEVSYEFTRREHKQIVFLEEKSTLFTLLGSTEVRVEEEYQLQDFYTLVATVGGSIGIFLGWSLRDLTKLTATAIDKLMKICHRTNVHSLQVA